jgi:hypothetical protein
MRYQKRKRRLIPLVCFSDFSEYLIDCLMELDITQEPAALRASFIKYFENKVQMLIDLLETDPTIQSKVEALYINMSDAVPLLEDTSVPNGDADVLNACNIVLSSYGQLYPESLRENQPDLVRGPPFPPAVPKKHNLIHWFLFVP